jgi:uncharacterized protein (DUF39 family)
MSSKNNCSGSVQIYMFSQKGGGFLLKNLVIFQTVDIKAISVDAFCCIQEVVFLFLIHI